MAFEDFATAAEMKTGARDAELDEDLFDFPVLESLEASPTRKVPEEDDSPKGATEPAADAKASSAAPEEEPTSKTEDPPPETTADADAGESVPGSDPELDEDLFDFPPPDAPKERVLAAANVDVEKNIDEAAKVVNELLEDDLEEVDGIPEEAPRSAARQTLPPPRSKAPPPPMPEATAESAPPPTAAEPAQVLVAPASGPVTLAPGDRRIAWALTTVAVVFLLGILAVAWHTTTGIGSSIEGLRGSLEAGNDRFAEQTERAMQRIAELEAQVLNQQKLATTAAAGVGGRGTPPEMMAPHELSLLVAEEALNEGRFDEARRVLYHLLATIDDLPEAARRDAEHTAAFLVARSYQEEATALEGGER